MKSFFITLLLILSTVSIYAQKQVVFPENNPIFSVIVPKGWTALEYSEYNVLEIYNGNESIVYSLYDLQTALLFEAVKRADSEAETEFMVHEYGSSIDEEINGITFNSFNGFGLTENDERFIIEVRLFRLNNNFYMVYYSAPKEDIDYYRIELDAMNRSIRAY